MGKCVGTIMLHPSRTLALSSLTEAGWGIHICVGRAGWTPACSIGMGYVSSFVKWYSSSLSRSQFNATKVHCHFLPSCSAIAV